jgi:pimeloyl-ACP methyl ester carboxylesterase
MPHVAANGIELEYEIEGRPDAPALVLVLGLGGQLTAWPDEVCAMLADRGFRVVRFDNRDCGLSTQCSGVPDLGAIFAGDYSSAPYRIEDMAADTVGLVDALSLGPAHVVGASMGGMIVQAMAIGHPGHVRSVCSIMSTTGDPAVGAPKPEVAAILAGGAAQPGAAPLSRDEAIAATVASGRLVAGSGFPFDEDEARLRAEAAYDRAYRPEGMVRQLAAVVSSPDRTEGLHGVRTPFLVIHGTTDPLITVSGGEATAEAVPGAELLLVPGMGHDLPQPVWPDLVDAIVANAERA